MRKIICICALLLLLPGCFRNRAEREKYERWNESYSPESDTYKP